MSYLSKLYDLDGDGVLDETEQQLRELDHGDGHLDVDKVYAMLLQQKAMNQRFFNMKRMTMILFLLVLVLAMANLGTACIAVKLTKETESQNGVLVDINSGKIIKTDIVVRRVVAKNERRRRDLEGTESVTIETTIAKQDAADLYNACGLGEAMILIESVDGQSHLVVCPADAYTQRGSGYTYFKGGKDLQISCSSDDVLEGEESPCLMSGSLLATPTIPPALDPPAGGSLVNLPDLDPYKIPAYNQIIYATYEDGTLNSGIDQLTGAPSNATDATEVANFGAHSSNHSICHKALLNDTSYYDHYTGKASSQTDTLNILAVRYAPGTEFIYKFSVFLPNWQEGPGPMDVIWQFQHALGEPDAMLGMRRNSLYIRYGKSTSRFRSESIVIANLEKHRDQWIDIEAHIRWEYYQDTGFIRLRVKTPTDPEPVMMFQVENYKTFTDNGSGDFGYVKWGMYRPESTLQNTPNDMYERVVCHDNIEITAVTYS